MKLVKFFTKNIIKIIIIEILILLIVFGVVYFYLINRKITKFTVFNLDYSYDLSENLRREIQVDNYGNYTIYLVKDGQLEMKKGKLLDKELHDLKKTIQAADLYKFSDTYDCFEYTPEKCPENAPTLNLLITLDNVPKNIHIYFMKTPWLLTRIINLSEKTISKYSKK